MTQLDLFLGATTAIRRHTDDDDRVITAVVDVADGGKKSPKKRLGPSSVFDLAITRIRSVRLRSAPVKRVSVTIEKASSRIRTVIDERDTPEWQEREFQRRARQILPPPPMSARTKSEKLKK